MISILFRHKVLDKLVAFNSIEQLSKKIHILMELYNLFLTNEGKIFLQYHVQFRNNIEGKIKKFIKDPQVMYDKQFIDESSNMLNYIQTITLNF